MSIAAIICEYNPFHNGHKFQIETQKNLFGTDGIIAIMSGNFVQRGEPAICDKWSRAKMALMSGVDLVIELPTVFATQSAERFARGGVSIADSLGIVDVLSFGAECDDVTLLKNASEVIEKDVNKGELSLELSEEDFLEVVQNINIKALAVLDENLTDAIKKNLTNI